MNDKKTNPEISDIGGREFAEMLRGGANRLSQFRTQINDLNVFPIPDGDTGDNMLMTFGSGVDAAEVASENLQSKAKAAADGMLLGARGNSGVILSRIFAGITNVLAAFERATVIELTECMTEGVRQAYGAVSEPVEGTILTVFKDAVAYANARAKENKSITGYFEDLLDEMERSLKRTPELLPVLKEAGVVDSGGAGLLCIFEGMRDTLVNDVSAAYPSEKTSENDKASVSNQPIDASVKKVDFSLFTEDSVLEYGYCTEFLLRLQRVKTDVDNFDIDAFIKFLNDNGDSVVAFKEGTIIKTHVHTKTPGKILDFAQRYGEFLTLKIENMTLQNEEAVLRGNNAQETLKKSADKKAKTSSETSETTGDAANEPTNDTTGENKTIIAKETPSDEKHAFTFKARKKTGIVAVAAGKGVKDTLISLGVDVVVDGGQCMNPSAGDLITAFDETNADRIFVFPNNGNVVLTAKQAAELYDKSQIVIIPTHTVGEGYSAISMMDTNAKTDDIVKDLTEIISSVVTGLVSKASRNAEVNGVSVTLGDYLGFSGDKIYADEKTSEDALKTLCKKLNAENYGLMLLFKGLDADKKSAQAVFEDLTKLYPNTEIIFIDGGQPIFDYTIVLE